GLDVADGAGEPEFAARGGDAFLGADPRGVVLGRPDVEFLAHGRVGVHAFAHAGDALDEVVGGSAAPLDELVAGGVLPRLGVEAVEFGLVYQGEVVAAVDLAVDLGVAAGLGEAPSGGIVADSAVEGVDDAGQQRVAVGRGGAAFGEREQRR